MPGRIATTLLRVLPLLCLLAPFAHAAEPSSTAWLINPSASQNPRLARVQPEVHSVALTDRYVEVRSAGISLYDLGPFQTPTNPVERLRQFSFRFPRHPELETKVFTSVRPDALGVFVNGMPIYNHFEAASYQWQNLWHFDSIANGDDGTWTAAGHPRAGFQHSFAPGLLVKLIADASGHSPIIGFAFDGYPIYGPWGFANADGTGGLRRMQSGYRLRQIKRRTTWPDGTQLTPGQFGPEINAEFPLGSFVEDYEFVAGAGELDEFNGRFTKTPEYPEGTYAYFLSTDANGRLAFPYLLARQYRGQISAAELNDALRDLAGEQVAVAACKELMRASRSKLELKAEGRELVAGEPIRLSFRAFNANNAPIRHLEFVHERPLHLIVVSDDLAEFDHIHPELVAGDRYEVTHTFKHGGRYRLYVDFTPPGSAQRIETFELTIGGKPRASVPLVASASLMKETAGLRFSLATKQPLRAGEDVELTVAVSDAATGKPVTDLEPYLGVWAHFVIIDQQKQNFIHAHPLETESAINNLALAHTHTAQLPGPSPAEIRFLASFPQSGLYKLWAQFQHDGKVVIQSFTLQASAAQASHKIAIAIPPDAVKVTIGASGFQPAQLKVDAGRPIKLAVTRDRQPNCGNRIVFPSLGITRDLPLGETIVVELPALPVGELRFTCGMGMYKGVIVAAGTELLR